MTHAITLPEALPYCVQEKRRIQAEIYEEIKDMTWKERQEYFRKGAEEFDRKVERFRAERLAESVPK